MARRNDGGIGAITNATGVARMRYVVRAREVARRKARKSRWFLAPTHVPIKGQWWSERWGVDDEKGEWSFDGHVGG
jgi:hypothetical protein